MLRRESITYLELFFAASIQVYQKKKKLTTFKNISSVNNCHMNITGGTSTISYLNNFSRATLRKIKKKVFLAAESTIDGARGLGRSRLQD